MSAGSPANYCVRANFTKGKWRLRRMPARQLNTSDIALLRAAQADGRSRNLAYYRQLGPASGVWGLELVKAALGDGEIAIGLADAFASRCRQQPDVAHEVCATGTFLSRRALVRALEDQGQQVWGSFAYRFLDVLQYMLAFLLAFGWWWLVVLRSVREKNHLPPEEPLLFAVHGEWSNRTRHLLRTTKQGQVILVLGRPRCSLVALAELWCRELGLQELRLVRPFDVRSACCGLVDGVALCLRGAGLMLGAPYKPRFADQVAIQFRCLLGTASSRWWQHSRARVKKVLYAHTGIADTTLLELAQQAGGAKTVHVVHGMSNGLNFTGLSSEAIFQCDYDARWHETLGGYGQCLATAAPRPEMAPPGEGILFLSNLLHPMNPWFRAFGADDELQALHAIARMADACGVQRKQVVWKPHPVFGQMSPDMRAAVLSVVASLGFSQWPEAAPLEMACRFRWIVCTRSTVALDVLKLGIMPVIYAPYSSGEEDVVSRFPLQAANAVRLAELVKQVPDPALYDRVWAEIGPGPGQISNKDLMKELTEGRQC